MKSWILTAALSMTLLPGGQAFAAKAAKAEKIPKTAEATGGAGLQSDKDKASYIIGQNIGKSFGQQGLDTSVIDLDKIRQGVEDALAGIPSAISEEETGRIMTAFQATASEKAGMIAQVKGAENEKAGAAFLAKNAKKPGVVVLPSGLQYKVSKKGTGAKPTADSKVTVHYTGTLIDGKEFDSSVGRGEPATFPVTGVIAGWTEALQLMPAGSKWTLYIPPHLAYKDQGAGPDIGPNATLVFDVELISVE